jgi:hypothetical protein
MKTAMLLKQIFRNSFIVCLLFVGFLFTFNFRTTDFIQKKSSKASFLKDGDVIFQINASGQGKAIQLATHSKYTHCGVVFMENGKPIVYEAVQPVKKTPLVEWVKYGEKDFYEVKRLKSGAVTADAVKKMKAKYATYEGKPYDLYFGWSDEKIYCSELVWKLYKEATGLEVGKLQKLKEFDLTHPAVKAKLRERYGDKIPLEELVISPAAIYESELLESVQVIK